MLLLKRRSKVMTVCFYYLLIYIFKRMMISDQLSIAKIMQNHYLKIIWILSGFLFMRYYLKANYVNIGNI